MGRKFVHPPRLLVQRDAVRLYEVPSSEWKDVTYQVVSIRYHDGAVAYACSCPAGRYARERGVPCKHVRATRELEERGVTADEKLKGMLV